VRGGQKGENAAVNYPMIDKRRREAIIGNFFKRHVKISMSYSNLKFIYTFRLLHGKRWL